ncbi:MAG: PAS domain S-box protein [Bacteroidota bacterium]
MSDSYQILLIEDNESDVELIQKELSSTDLIFELNVIRSKQQLIKSIPYTSPHLVISDYKLPSLNGTEALNIVRRDHPNIPFILISGFVGEEKAVEAMRQGASDYIFKENLSRLVPAIKRELSNYEIPKKGEHQKEQVYANLQERVKEQECIYQISSLSEQELSTAELLEQALQYLPGGWTYPEITEASISFSGETFKTDNYSKTPWILESQKTSKLTSDTLTIRVVYLEEKPDKDEGPFLFEERQLLDLVAELLVLKIDQIHSERALRKKDKIISKAYDLAQIGHWELDIHDKSLSWSQEIKRLHEVSHDYEPDLDSAISFYKEGKHRQKIQRAVQKAIDEGTPFDVELKIVTAKNNERWIRAVGEAEFEDGQCVRIYGSTQNINTRKRSEEKLKETEQRLREILENSTNMFYRHNTNHVLTYLSPQCEDFLGYAAEEAKRRWTEFATDHPTNKQGFTFTKNAIETGESQPPFELQLKKKNGEIIWVLVNEAPITEHGETVAIVGSLTDITDQKNYEDKLEQLSLVASKTTDIIIITDKDENITWVNNAFENETGYALEEILGKKPSFLQGPETNPQTIKRISQKLDKLETVQEVILNYAKNGQKYWLDMTIDPILDEKGKCTGFIAIEKDVTAEIERSRKLQESVERYEIVSKATSDTIWDHDLRTNTIQYNQNIYSMFGYQKHEVDEVSEWWTNKIHPSDQKNVQQKFEHILSSQYQDRLQLEYRFKTADDSYKYIFDRAFIVRDNDSNPIRIIGAMQDITNFKERQQRSRKFQEVISNLATNRSLQKMEILDGVNHILEASAKALNVERVNLWLLEGNKLRCVCSYENGQYNAMRGEILTQKQSPTYFRYINEKRIIAAENPAEHEAFTELTDSYLKSNNIQSILDTSVLSYGSTQAVVCHESISNKRDWESDEISFAGSITDQIAQLMASQEKKKRDQEIRESLKEKETLLAEVHHRVKNNLAVVSGMMQLQAYDESNKALKDKLFDSVTRIQTMAAIHELLYQSNSFSNLRLDENIERLIDNIFETFQSKASVSLDLTLEPLPLNVNQAIPCSLIVNEVTTNALKHAFDEEKQGKLTVFLSEKENQINLKISDNGRGLPSDFDKLVEQGSLGFKLIDTLSSQLEGSYEFKSDGTGTQFSLTFNRAEIKGIGSAHLD